jgi:hypothetical protein
MPYTLSLYPACLCNFQEEWSIFSSTSRCYRKYHCCHSLSKRVTLTLSQRSIWFRTTDCNLFDEWICEGVNLIVCNAEGFMVNGHQITFSKTNGILESFARHSPFTVSLWN